MFVCVASRPVHSRWDICGEIVQSQRAHIHWHKHTQIFSYCGENILGLWYTEKSHKCRCRHEFITHTYKTIANREWWISSISAVWNHLYCVDSLFFKLWREFQRGHPKWKIGVTVLGKHIHTHTIILLLSFLTHTLCPLGVAVCSSHLNRQGPPLADGVLFHPLVMGSDNTRRALCHSPLPRSMDLHFTYSKLILPWKYRLVLCIEQDLGITKGHPPARGGTLSLILLELYIILAAIYTLQQDAVYKLAFRCKVTAPGREITSMQAPPQKLNS